MEAKHPKKKAEQRARALNLDVILGGIVVAALLGGLVLLGWNHYNKISVQEDYEGTIVDRWAGSREGSQPYFRLVIEAPDGKRDNVEVDPDRYKLTKVGMRIKSRAGKVVLVESSQSPAKTDY